MPNWIFVLAGYLLIVSVGGFVSMGMDKRKAQRRKWRIRESTLFLWALIGGSLGSVLGMLLFHHKTKHWYFMLGLPAILISQGILLFYFLRWMEIF